MSVADTSTGQARRDPQKPGKLALFFLRGNPWPAVLWSTLILLGALWDGRMPQRSMRALATPDFLLTGAILMAAGRIAQLFLRNVFQGIYGPATIALRSKRWFWPYLVVLVMTGCFAINGRWPLTVAFALSRADFDKDADEVLADPEKARQFAGERIGLYELSSVEVIGDAIFFYLDDYRGKYGFARIPRAKDSLIQAKDAWFGHEVCDDLPLGFNGHDRVGMRLDGDWFVLYSHFSSVIHGWSKIGPATDRCVYFTTPLTNRASFTVPMVPRVSMVTSSVLLS